MPAPAEPVPAEPVPAALAADAPCWAWLPLPRGQAAEPVARRWLAGRLDTTTTALVLQRDERGRPQLGGKFGDWDCNWSHSGAGLLVALGRNLHVGIDLEWLRPRPRAQELARRFFHADEADWLDRLDAPARQQAFVRLWCAKEAVLKAHGHGLSFGLDKLVLVDTPGGLRLADCDPALGTPAQWTLEALAPFPGYVGALAWRST
ncbi:MAG TPA: 4'-phosphopantetheinyl transferase superfamily protein [Lysobacter sp.]|nr:4'-phosphopantetheinyl transferase superfamily protein [Lysobacter sp.]